jgi:hypothetical protein
MAAYLSDDWIAALDGALSAAAGIQDLAPLLVEQVVTGVPGRGEVRYRISVDGNGGHARPARADDPAADLRLTTDYPTAVAIARGAQNAQIALAQGRLRLGGNLESVAPHGRALGVLGDIAAKLRDTTTFAAP